MNLKKTTKHYLLQYFITSSIFRRPKIKTSIIFKFGQGSKPDPTIPLQKAMKKNKGKFPSPVNEKAKIKKIIIVPPGRIQTTQ